MKILYLGRPFNELMPDMLYDGLMKNGHDVTVFPPKPNLSDGLDDVRSYSWPWQPVSYDDVMRECDSFDIAVLTTVDSNQSLAPTLKSIIKKVKCPIVLLNDMPFHSRADYDELLGGKHPIAEFRCEVLKNQKNDRNWDVIPLPYSFREEFLVKEMPRKRFDVFFSCRSDGWGANDIRFKIVNTLPQVVKNCIASYENPILPYSHYLEVMRESWIGISVKGQYWNTVRYWEVVGCQAGLVSDNLNTKVIIPNNFEEGRHARFYNDVDEMIDIIKELLANKDELKEMIRRAYEHLLKYHLNTHRAKTFIKEVEKRL